MMSKKSPQLRFEGFTDDWEERKLSSGLREYTDRVIVEDDKEYYQISVRNNFGGITLRGSKMGNKIGRKRQAKINLTKYPQTLIFTRQTVEQGGIGWVDKYCDGAIVTENMPTISLDTSVFSKYFLTNLFQTRIFYKNAILDNIEGGSAQIAIHESKFLSSTLLFPNLDEQEKIGQFFKQLDDTIDLHQRKLDLLKEQKKGYLQKMFPKNGAKVPELRFAGFADDWEERKLSDLFIKGGSGGTPKSTNKAFYDGDIPFLGISDITKSNGFINNTEKHISSDGLNSSAAWIVSKGAISLAMYASVGKLAILNIDAATSQAFYNMIFDDYDLRDLVYQRLNKANELSEWNKLISTGTQSNLNADKVKNFQMYLPKNHDEIKLISTFFKQIDNTIALHQRKLDLLKEQKKGFLQKMFV